jgi:elongation factor 1-gamma
VQVAAKSNDLDIELVNTEANAAASFNQSAEYTKVSPLGKIPAFEGANGFVLSEVIALVVYGMYLKEFLALLKCSPPLYDECFFY